MRDNHFDPATELVIAGIDTDDGPEHPCFNAESNAISDDSDIIQGMKKIMLTDIGFFGAVTVTTIGRRRYVNVGRKRTRALRLANIERAALGLPPLKIMVDHKQYMGERRNLALREMAEAENWLRLNAKSPLAAPRAATALKNGGSSIESISLAMGATQNGVRRWLKIGELSLAVQEAIEAGQIAEDAALLLHGKPEPEQDAKLAAWINQKVAESAAEDEARTKSEAPSATPSPEERRGALVAKKRNRKSGGKQGQPPKPKRVSKQDAAASLGIAVKRSAKTLRKLMALPAFAASDDFRRGVQWAIGDLTDADVGVFTGGGK